MPDLGMLDVGIGIIFLYVLISIICSAVRESIEALLNKRAAYLELAIRELLDDREGKGLARRFYEHPLIAILYPGDYGARPLAALRRITSVGGNLPAYIPEGSFAMALLDLAARGPVGKKAVEGRLDLATVRENLHRLDNPAVERALLIAIEAANGEMEKARANIEFWFNSAMEGITGQYRRATNWVIFWIAFAVAVSINVDTFRIADYLYRNDSVRAVLVARATEAAQSPELAGYAEAKAELDALQLPIGWLTGMGPKLGRDAVTGSFLTRQNLLNLLSFVPGWLMTALAATLGAPFWFDLLKKFMMVRTSIRPGVARVKSEE